MRADAGRLGHRLADELDRAAVRLDQAEAAAQRRRLACAVRSEQSEAFAAADLERQAAHDFLRAVALAQSLDAQHRIDERRRIRADRRCRREAQPARQSIVNPVAFTTASPARVVGGETAPELVGRARRRLHADAAQLRDDVGRAQRLVQMPIERLHGRGRRVHVREESEPAAGLEILESELGERGHVGNDRRALRARTWRGCARGPPCASRKDPRRYRSPPAPGRRSDRSCTPRNPCRRRAASPCRSPCRSARRRNAAGCPRRKSRTRTWPHSPSPRSTYSPQVFAPDCGPTATAKSNVEPMPIGAKSFSGSNDS